MAALKKVACETIDGISSQLHDLNQKIWNQPELQYEEKYAHDELTAFLEQQTFEVTRHFTLETAFRGRGLADRKTRNVGIICEYDALPGIGHACGHNLIAAAGAGAAVGIKKALESSKEDLGTITVLGTPAEEGGGGKIAMIKNGAFSDIDVCMMVHPKSFNCIYPSCLALRSVHVDYHGKSSHAAAFPWEGVNALDAAISAYTSLSALRQQLKPRWRLHGIITEGGSKPNIIPEKASLSYMVRAPTERELQVLCDKVDACFQAAATATGCKVNVTWESNYYADLRTNNRLAQLYQANAESFGLNFPSREEQQGAPVGSTDFGNVSKVVPAIHPFFGIQTDVANHTREFTEAAGKPEAHEMTLIQAKILACTALDVLCSEQAWAEIQSEFKAQSTCTAQSG